MLNKCKQCFSWCIRKESFYLNLLVVETCGVFNAIFME